MLLQQHQCIQFFYSTGLDIQLKEQKSITCILDCVSDDKLCEITFYVYLERIFSLLSTSIISSDLEVERQLEVQYEIQMLWGLFKKCNSSMKQRMALYVAKKPQLTTLTLKAMCTYLESYGTFMLCYDEETYQLKTT